MLLDLFVSKPISMPRIAQWACKVQGDVPVRSWAQDRRLNKVEESLVVNILPSDEQVELGQHTHPWSHIQHFSSTSALKIIIMRRQAAHLLRNALRSGEASASSARNTTTPSLTGVPIVNVAVRTFADDANLLKTPLYDFHVEHGGKVTWSNHCRTGLVTGL